MIKSYREVGGTLEPLTDGADPASALWIDVCSPLPSQVATLATLGIAVPTLEDMEEIEISNRLYREDGAVFITIVLPGQSEAGAQTSGPVCFILTPARIVTVRHHMPRPFETYPMRADKVGPGCGTPDRIFLGLLEEIIGRLADLLEGSGKALDDVSRMIFASTGEARPAAVLQASLEKVGREGDVLARVRLALLTMERAISFFTLGFEDRKKETLTPLIKSLMRDVQALEVHTDFIGTRVALATDATLGMINLAQNSTVRIVSVVAVLFLPPTLIASIYGMNFRVMPELAQSWGYPMALGLMVASGLLTYLFFKWRNWL